MARFALMAALVCSAPTLAHAEDEAPPLSIYGAARLDVLADDSRMNDILQPLYVLREPMNGKLDGETTMTPRLSQLGLSIDEWELDNRGRWKSEGKLEVDFGGGSRTGVIRLRHAYGQLTYKKGLEVLAGQTWDLASPLYPSAQNDTQLLFAGNIGDRRPQLRVTTYPNEHLRLAVAAAATGTLDQRDLDGDGQLDGMAAATPMLQMLLEVRMRVHRGATLRAGMFGHVARDELANGTRYPSRSVGGYLFFPVVSRLAWIGEFYVGNNATDLGGGIGQGVNAVTGRTIRSFGGWGELAALPTKRHMIAVGGSGDFAAFDDLAMGDRWANGTVYGVLRYKPTTALQLGLEYLYWRTLYRGMGEGVANRFNFHMSVFF
ncbi:MAG: hypothetical protein SFX73_24770 [Kofleriaceae bacterium]|nr:hypothetical protein [Kofleriaceae bacterium]